MSVRRHGFTFVEVTIAIAILAFAVVSMIGLLTIGLSSEKSSSDSMRVATMANYVITTEMTNAFSTVSQNGYTNFYYFDALGNVTNATPTPAFYMACTVSNSTGITNAGNYNLFQAFNVNSSAATNMVSMTAIFTYPRGSLSQKTNVFYFNRANE